MSESAAEIAKAVEDAFCENYYIECPEGALRNLIAAAIEQDRKERWPSEAAFAKQFGKRISPRFSTCHDPEPTYEDSTIEAWAAYDWLRNRVSGTEGGQG